MSNIKPKRPLIDLVLIHRKDSNGFIFWKSNSNNLFLASNNRISNIVCPINISHKKILHDSGRQGWETDHCALKDGAHLFSRWLCRRMRQPKAATAFSSDEILTLWRLEEEEGTKKPPSSFVGGSSTRPVETLPVENDAPLCCIPYCCCFCIRMYRKVSKSESPFPSISLLGQC